MSHDRAETSARRHTFICVEKRGTTGVVTFQRPEVMNAWNRAMRREIAAACVDFETAVDVRAVVFTGSGSRAFGAGQDLLEAPPAYEDIDDWVNEWGSFFSALRAISKPTIAALNGVAAGSAFQFALMADFRIGHPGVRMGQPEIKSGVASSIGPWIMRETLGLVLATDLALTGRIMNAAECQAAGLLTRMVPADEVLDEAIRFGTDLASNSAFTTRLTKQRLSAMTRPGFEQALVLWKDLLRASRNPSAGNPLQSVK